MLTNDTLKNGTSRIGLYGGAPPPREPDTRPDYIKVQSYSKYCVKVRPSLSVTRCYSPCNLCCDSIARQVSGSFFFLSALQDKFQVVFFPSSLSHNLFGLASRARFYFLRQFQRLFEITVIKQNDLILNSTPKNRSQHSRKPHSKKAQHRPSKTNR